MTLVTQLGTFAIVALAYLLLSVLLTRFANSRGPEDDATGPPSDTSRPGPNEEAE